MMIFFPMVSSRRTEIETYKTLEPATRLVILKAICDIRVEVSFVKNKRFSLSACYSCLTSCGVVYSPNCVYQFKFSTLAPALIFSYLESLFPYSG